MKWFHIYYGYGCIGRSGMYFLFYMPSSRAQWSWKHGGGGGNLIDPKHQRENLDPFAIQNFLN